MSFSAARLLRLVWTRTSSTSPSPSTGGTRMLGIETNDFKPKIAEFMHQPRRHRSGLDSYANVISRMPTHQKVDLCRNRGALTQP